MEVLPGERVMATYGDGLGNINIPESLKFHEKNKKLATVTAVRPPARFGYLEIENGQVLNFGEKNQSDTGWINGGFFILEPEVCKFIKSYEEPFETEALPTLTKEGQLGAFKHSGFWQPMDTLRERNNLKKLVGQKTPPPWLNILS
jgi:glucose-1-phosphate cytidylyltransferase